MEEDAVLGGPSVLSSLRDRREEIRKSEHLVLAVPRWHEPKVLVRYAPVDHDSIRKGQNRVEKAPAKLKSETEVNVNVDILVRGCVGVFARVEGDPTEYSLRPGDEQGDLTKFDGDLAANLGVHEGATARDIVRALFFTDGDILSQAGELVRWSGYRDTEADEGLAGE